MFGLLMRHWSWPLAIMLSADRVPIKNTRSIGAWGLMGCPGLWADWLGALSVHCPFQPLARSVVPRVFVLPPYADCGSGVR